MLQQRAARTSLIKFKTSLCGTKGAGGNTVKSLDIMVASLLVIEHVLYARLQASKLFRCVLCIDRSRIKLKATGNCFTTAIIIAALSC